MRVDVAILAGADNDGRLAEVSDAKYEAVVDINGKPMVEWFSMRAGGANL